MGIINTVWWTVGLLTAFPLVGLGVRSVLAERYPEAALFLGLGLLVLFLPEYIRWRLFGGGSVLERVPLFGTRGDDDGE